MEVGKDEKERTESSYIYIKSVKITKPPQAAVFEYHKRECICRVGPTSQDNGWNFAV